MKNEIKDFRTSTVGLFASHENLKTNKMIRADIHNASNGDIALVAVSANNLNRIKSIKPVFVDFEEYENSPEDPYDNTVFAKWCFNKLGITILK